MTATGAGAAGQPCSSFQSLEANDVGGALQKPLRDGGACFVWTVGPPFMTEVHLQMHNMSSMLAAFQLR